MPTLDPNFARIYDFQLFPCTVELTTFSCSRWPRTPKIGRYRAIYTPFSIRTLRSFPDTMVMPKECQLSTPILRELTIFSYFPALLSWKLWHFPDKLEPRNWAKTELFTLHLVSKHLKVSRIQCRASRMPTFVLHFERNEDFWLFPRTIELETLSCSQ